MLKSIIRGFLSCNSSSIALDCGNVPHPVTVVVVVVVVVHVLVCKEKS